MTRSHKGLFITLEGGEGAGKSTLSAGLVDRFASVGQTCVRTREPGGTPKGEEMRKVLLAGVANKLGPLGEALLFASARDEHIKMIIKPALDKGEVVICDRFADSTRAYQGYVGGVERTLIERLDTIVVGKMQPDVTFVIDIPAEVGLERVKQRKIAADRFESEDMSFHHKLRAAYFDIAQRFPARCIVLDGLQPPDIVLEKAWEALARHPAFAQH